MSTIAKSQALHTFWSRFTIPAYDEGSVPIGAQMPYITYNVREEAGIRSTTLTASLWYKGASWADIETKAAAISDYVGLGGVLEKYTGGAIWLKRGRPFSQRVIDEDDSVRRILIQLEGEFISQD